MVFRWKGQKKINRHYKNDKVTITVSKNIAKWKDSENPVEVRWYRFLVGHEYGHNQLRRYDEHPPFDSDGRSSDEKATDAEEINGQTRSDKVAVNISGISRDEYIELFNHLIERELPILYNEYIQYLKSFGVSAKTIESLDTLSDIQERVKKGYKRRLVIFDKK